MSPIINTDDYVTQEKAAELLGIKLQSVRNQIALGNLPTTTFFGERVIPKAAIEAYRQRTQPDGEPKRGRPRKKKE